MMLGLLSQYTVVGYILLSSYIVTFLGIANWNHFLWYEIKFPVVQIKLILWYKCKWCIHSISILICMIIKYPVTNQSVTSSCWQRLIWWISWKSLNLFILKVRRRREEGFKLLKTYIYNTTLVSHEVILLTSIIIYLYHSI